LLGAAPSQRGKKGKKKKALARPVLSEALDGRRIPGKKKKEGVYLGPPSQNQAFVPERGGKEPLP